MAQQTGRLRGGLSVLVIGLVIGAIVAACGGSSATASPSAAASSGSTLDGTWALTQYTTVDGTQVTVPSAVTPTITFAGNAASGSAGCNSFNATATISGDQVRFDQVASTKLACQDPLATVEAAYLQALNLVTMWTVTGNTLVLTNPAGKPALSFVKGT
ncbi:MAG TPA: META domain-containing protein [Candidatus Limnocylindrales bacterium]|jgi:heat shock protein HslJ